MAEEVRLVPGTMWCERHLDRFKERWPVGYLIATMYMLETALVVLGVRANGNEKKMVAQLVASAPLCCLAEEHYGAEWLDEIVRRAIAMDPKLVQEIKESRGRRTVARIQAEKSRWKAKR